MPHALLLHVSTQSWNGHQANNGADEASCEATVHDELLPGAL
jgi:hypothetical protein